MKIKKLLLVAPLALLLVGCNKATTGSKSTTTKAKTTQKQTTSNKTTEKELKGNVYVDYSPFCLKITGDGENAIGKEVTLKAETAFGLKFTGWYDGDTLLEESATYTFTLRNNYVELKATAESVDELKPFNFFSNFDGSTVRIDTVFDEYKDIEEIVIPDYVTEINSGAFRECTSLKKLTVPFVGLSPNSDDRRLYKLFGEAYNVPTTLKEIVVKNVDSIPNAAFTGLQKVETITYPDTITSIGNNAFYNCSSLTSIQIPNSVTSIGQFAFEKCSCDLIWGDNPQITDLADCIFCGYVGDELLIPNSVETITGKQVFSGCSSEILWGENPKIDSIIGNAFRGYLGTSLTIPNSVTKIENGALYGMKNIESLTIPFVAGKRTYTDPFGYVFGNIGSTGEEYTTQYGKIYYIPQTLKEVTITDDTSIPAHAFESCRYLTKINLANNTETIGEQAFRGCTSLKSFSFPEEITTIESSTLGGCTSLESVYIPDSVTKIKQQAFDGCRSLKSLVIPKSVTSIGQVIVGGCYSLESLTIPFIGSTREDNSRPLGYFFDSTTSYVPPADQTYVYTSTQYVYEMGSGRVAKDYYLPKTLKTLIITDEPELLYGQIFDCTSIVDVIMSKSITKIDNAFGYNTNMEHFYYEGSKSEWEQVNRVAPGCGTVYCYSETEPTEAGNYWRYIDGVPTIWVIE